MVTKGEYIRRRSPSVTERFTTEYHVLKESNCWEWHGETSANGQPIFGDERAHRYSWRTFQGPLSDDVFVIQTCGNRSCVNPKHLELVEVGIYARRQTQRVEARFWDKVDLGHPSGCWVWIGAKRTGYGLLGKRQAHHVAWELRTGAPVPPNHEIIRSCGRTDCVRFDHLKSTTRKERYAKSV